MSASPARTAAAAADARDTAVALMMLWMIPALAFLGALIIGG